MLLPIIKIISMMRAPFLRFSNGILNDSRSFSLQKSACIADICSSYVTSTDEYAYIYDDLIEITSDWSPEIIFLAWYTKELTGRERPACSIRVTIGTGPFTVEFLNLVFRVLILLKWHSSPIKRSYYNWLLRNLFRVHWLWIIGKNNILAYTMIITIQNA